MLVNLIMHNKPMNYELLFLNPLLKRKTAKRNKSLSCYDKNTGIDYTHIPNESE